MRLNNISIIGLYYLDSGLKYVNSAKRNKPYGNCNSFIKTCYKLPECSKILIYLKKMNSCHS